MKLAKDRLDIGLMTDDPAMLAFMADEVGLGAPDILPISRAVTQHRFDVEGSVVKVNMVEGLASERRSGYSEVLIAEPGRQTARTLTGPDGVVVSLVPPGERGVAQLGVRLRVADLSAARRYFGEALGWPVADAMVRVGASVVLLDEDTNAPRRVELPVRGWTYLTVQIHDCDFETEGAVSRGAVLAQAAITLGEVARYSMVADPWGNALEISQRASLTGPLPPG